MYLLRAVDDKGEVLDMLVQKRRNKAAALKLLRKLLKKQCVYPEKIITDQLAPHRATACDLGLTVRHVPGGMRENKRAENSHRPIRRRERTQQKFKSRTSAQSLLATHAAITNVVNRQPHLISRPTLGRLRTEAHRTWEAATAAGWLMDRIGRSLGKER